MNDKDKAVYFLEEMNYQNVLVEVLEKTVKDNGNRVFTFTIEIDLNELEVE